MAAWRILGVLIAIAGATLAWLDASINWPALAAGALIAGGLALLVARGGGEPEATLLPAARDQPRDDLADAVIQAIDDALLLVEDGRVIRANATATRLFGGHLLDEDYRLVIRHPAAAHAFGRTRPGVPGEAVLAGVGSDERRFAMHVTWISEACRLVRLSDRTSAAVVEKVRTDFVANASHELRTPLSTLIGFIETLEDRNAADHAQTRARFLGIMMKEARRMQQLVDDLISLSRIEGERLSAPGTAVALNPLIGEIRDAMTGAMRLAPDRIVVQLPAETVTVAGDRGQLSQLLHNLVGNALKYGRANAPVTLGLRLERTRAALFVADQGEGIAPEHLPRITERFYRVDPGRSRALGGTGLGLAIVKHIVERHRGRLAIDSKQGVGTTVTVSLPLLADGRGDADD